MSLASALDGARFVRFDSDTGIVCAWFGGHGVNAYDEAGRELDHWNVGDFAQPAATVSEVVASVDAWLARDPDDEEASLDPRAE